MQKENHSTQSKLSKKNKKKNLETGTEEDKFSAYKSVKLVNCENDTGNWPTNWLEDNIL